MEKQKLIIREFWSSNGGYEQNSFVSYRPESRTAQEFKKDMRKTRGFVGIMDDGSAKFDLGIQYGIHRYQTVKIEKEV